MTASDTCLPRLCGGLGLCTGDFCECSTLSLGLAVVRMGTITLSFSLSEGTKNRYVLLDEGPRCGAAQFAYMELLLSVLQIRRTVSELPFMPFREERGLQISINSSLVSVLSLEPMGQCNFFFF